MQEQEQKLRGEYLSLGGSANSSIPNYFLYIIIGISFLAVCIFICMLSHTAQLAIQVHRGHLSFCRAQVLSWLSGAV